MATTLDILINAAWRGSSATSRAQQDLAATGRAATEADVQMAAMQARSQLLGNRMGELSQQVALGNITVEEAKKEYNEFAGSLGETGKVAQRQGVNFTSLATKIGAVTIALGAAGLAGRRAFEVLEEGASIDLTTRRFDRLAESIGTTGDALRRDLLDATSGMLSTTQAMSLATDLLALDLATTSDQAVRLARVVTELDIDMNELSLTIANQSRRRFDQMGVSLDGFDERLERLSETMSDEQAFSMAFLEQAEAQIEKVGGASETAAGDLRRMTAAWDEVKTAFQLGAVEGVADILGTTGEDAEATRGAFATLAQHAGQLAGPGALGGLAAVLLNLNPAFAGNAALLKIYTDLIKEQADEAARAAAINELWANSLPNQQLGVTAQATEDLGMAASLTADEIAELASQAEGMFGGLMDMDVSELERQLAELPTSIQLNVEAGELERLTERADLFADFQADLTDISEREQERRAELEAQHEERRSEIVDEHGRRRAEEEAAWQLRRRRQEQQLQADIADVREESEERRAELREEANDRLADLEEDHADRMRQIIEDAAFDLRGAAARLDAGAVARIKEQRDRALSEEEKRYADSRDDILETLEERLEAEREAEQERIEELEENLAERQRIEEEDRRIRLRKMEEAHRRQLRELDENHRDRLNKLQQQAQQERNERERQYQLEHSQLVNFWERRTDTANEWMRTILDREEEWWAARAGEGDFDGTTTGGTGSDDDDTITSTGEAGVATRHWMEQTALRVANPTNTEEANAWSRFFNTLSDQALADWIEEHSDIDVPGYREGGPVEMTGIVQMHGTPTRPEYVLSPETTRQVARLLGEGFTQADIIHALTTGERTPAIGRAPEDRTVERFVESERLLSRELMGEIPGYRHGGPYPVDGAPTVGGFPSVGGAAGGGGVIIEEGAINMPIHGAPGQSPQEIGREVERSLRRVFERLGS